MLGEPGAHVLQQHRHGLGARDDRQEVAVAAPARHDVLVQVGRDAGPATAPWFIPRLKPIGADAASSARTACLVSRVNSAVSSSVRST